MGKRKKSEPLAQAIEWALDLGQFVSYNQSWGNDLTSPSHSQVFHWMVSVDYVKRVKNPIRSDLNAVRGFADE